MRYSARSGADIVCILKTYYGNLSIEPSETLGTRQRNIKGD
jgi:hypothetical protein